VVFCQFLYADVGIEGRGCNNISKIKSNPGITTSLYATPRIWRQIFSYYFTLIERQ
jgi:hypothetical protein